MQNKGVLSSYAYAYEWKISSRGLKTAVILAKKNFHCNI
jgi:hypothetical protein